MKTFVILLIFFILFSLNTFAQDYTQWGLPEGAKARLGKGSITGDIAYSPDSTRLAVASSIGIWLYDAQTGEELDLLTGHTGSVRSVVFSPDGDTLASGSRDATVRLWVVNTGAAIRIHIRHTSRVNSVVFSPDGNTLASGSWDDTVRLWAVNTGAAIRTLTGHTGSVNSVVFSPDGNTLASWSWDGTILLWELTSSTTPTGQIKADVNGDVANAGTEASDFNTDFEYRIGGFSSLGIGAKYLAVLGEEGIGTPNLSLEFGWCKRASNGAYASHSLELEAVMPKVGYIFRYFPRLQSQSSQRQFYVAKFGAGEISLTDDDLAVQFLFDVLGPLRYVRGAAGVGYQWARYSTIEFLVSYTRSSYLDWISAGVMLRGVLW